MPFRGIMKDVKPGEPEQLLVAQPGDLEVQVSVAPYGAAGVSGAPNFRIGGPAIADEGGMLVTSNEFTTDLSEGDELWVAAVEDLAWSDHISISALVRSVKG